MRDQLELKQIRALFWSDTRDMLPDGHTKGNCPRDLLIKAAELGLSQIQYSCKKCQRKTIHSTLFCLYWPEDINWMQRDGLYSSGSIHNRNHSIHSKSNKTIGEYCLGDDHSDDHIGDGNNFPIHARRDKKYNIFKRFINRQTKNFRRLIN